MRGALPKTEFRFVQLFDWGWDFHGTNPKEDIRDGLTNKCATMDKPIAALINDLKERGLFEDTLIILGGEFGRTPFREGRTAKGKVLGRDHFPDCYTMVMAGGGVKGDTPTARPMILVFRWPVTKSTFTIYRLPGCIFLGLTMRNSPTAFRGRDYRLTDVHGKVVKDLFSLIEKA